MKNLIYLLFFVFISCKSYGQIAVKHILSMSDSLVESVSYDLGEKFLLSHISSSTELENHFQFYAQLCYLSKSNSKIEQTIKYGHKATQKQYSVYTHLEPYGDVLYNLSVANFRRGEIDSSFFYAEKALEIRRQYLPANHKKIVQNLIALGTYHSNIGETELSIDYQKQALAIALNIKPLNYNSLVGSHFGLGSAYQSSNRLYKARDEYEKALVYYKDSLADNNIYKAHIYNAIGVILESQKDYLSSQEYYKEAIVLFTDKAEIFSTATAYSNLANNYTNLGRNTEAKKIHKKVISLIEAENFPNELPWKYLNLGATYIECSQYDSALVVLEKAELLNIKVSGGANNELTTIILNHFAQAYMELDKYEKAEDMLNKSITIAIELFGLKDLDLAESYYLLAKNYYSTQNHSAVLEELTKAENALILSQSTNIDFTEEIISRTLLLDIYILREQTLWQEYLKSKNISYLSTLYETTINTNKLSDVIIDYYEHEGAKLDLFISVNENLYLGIVAAKELYEITGDHKYTNQALTFFEAEKSFLLKQEYSNLKAKNNNHISDSLLLREDYLKREISQNQNLLFTENQPKSEYSKSLSSNIFKLKREISDLLKFIELNNPQYFAQKYQKIEFNIENVRTKLDREELFIEYYQHKNEVFSISVSKGTTQFNKIVIDSLDEKIYAYNKAILESDIETYTSLAYELYTNLLEKQLLKHTTKQVCIVPSKSISLVSFDTFVTEKPKEKSYNKLNYLLQTQTISYKNSLQETYDNYQQCSQLYIGVSPSFKGQGVSTLEGAYTEVRSISELFGGHVLDNESNLKEELLSKISNFKIVHFATHANINVRNSSYSSLLLSTDTSVNKNKLHAYEIQNTKLNAELVVLSACNTGIGELKKGEGLASLARSFNYAGAHSVIVGLWALPDFSTSIIVKDFFSELSLTNKALALKRAKVKYLKNADEHTSNPIYWAGLVLIGEKKAIELSIKETRDYSLLIAGLVLSIILVLVGKKFI